MYMLFLRILLRICYIDKCNTAFKEHLPENGHNRWPKYVEGYAVYNAINLNICIANTLMLKLYYLHSVCHNSDVFGFILIIFRKLPNINNAYIKKQMDC